MLIEGRLRADPKTGGPATFTRQDGSVGSAFEIVANTVRFQVEKALGLKVNTVNVHVAGLRVSDLD